MRSFLKGQCNLLEIENNTVSPVDFMFVFSKYDAMSSMPIESGDGFCVWSSTLMKQETMEAGKRFSDLFQSSL